MLGSYGIFQLGHPRQCQQHTAARLRQQRIRQDPGKGIHQLLFQQAIGLARSPSQHRLPQQHLARIPTGKGIAVAGQQVHQLAGGAAHLELHRR